MNNQTYVFKAPATGKSVPVKAIHNPLLSSLELGDGVSVFPEDGTVVSPCHAIVTSISADNHSMLLSCIKSALNILISVDTQAGGVTFTPAVTSGKIITAGETLFTFDLAKAKATDGDTSVSLVLTDKGSIDTYKPAIGNVEAGQTDILEVSCVEA